MNTSQLMLLRLTTVCLFFHYAPVGVHGQAPWPTSGWATSSPEEQGMDRTSLMELVRGVRTNRYGYVNRMVVIRHGFMVLDESFEHDYAAASRGRDTTSHQYNYYHPDWHPYLEGRDVHTLQSVTKSVTATLIGVALRRGEIGSLQDGLLSFLTAHDLSSVDDRLQRATLEHLLTMRTGIEWHETDRPFNETNTTVQLEASEDWVRFTLAQPMDAEPGEKWTYNSGGSHLMSAVLLDATGLTVDRYAERYLFEPLGISDFHWKRTPTGLPDTEGGLYLDASQLAKVGYLYLKDGVWDGERLLPEGWVARATAQQVSRVNAVGWGYGYQWWRLDRSSVEIWAGLGFGGQYLIVIPNFDVIGVVNSWNVFDTERQSILGPFIDALLTIGEDSDDGV